MKILVFLALTLGSILVQAKTDLLSVGVPYGFNRNQALIQYYAFLSEALKDAGYETDLKKLPGTLPYESLIKGDVDSIAYDDMSLTQGRDQVVSISFPIVAAHAYVFYNSENKKFNEKNLKKYRCALTLNNSVIEKEAKAKHLKYITTGSPFQSVQLLLDKKIDYFLAVEEVGKSTLASHPDSVHKIKMSNEVFLKYPLYFTLHKKYKKDIPRIEESFRKHLNSDLSAYPLIQKHLNKNALNDFPL